MTDAADPGTEQQQPAEISAESVEESHTQVRQPAWTTEQSLRLQNEWRRLQRETAYHPFVQLVPLHGSPPFEYQIEYRLRTLALAEDGQLDFTPTCTIQLSLPDGFPLQPPDVRPLTPLFHPNVSQESIQLIPAWDPNTSLLDVVMNVGRLLAFQLYDPHQVSNPDAMQWVEQNFSSLPTDPDADFSTNAGDDALRRICKHGHRTLHDLQEQTTQVYEYLMSPDSEPQVEELAAFSSRMHLSLELLLEPDIPDNLREPANELFEWARELPASLPAWLAARRMRDAAYSVSTLTTQFSAAKDALARQVQSLASQVKQPPSASPVDVIANLPDAQDLRQAHGTLHQLTQQNMQFIQAISNELSAVDSMPPVRITVHAESSLGAKIRDEMTRQMSAMKAARDRGKAMIAAVQPAVALACQELETLERAISYREYGDLRDQALKTVHQICQWGAVGVQAFFVQTEEEKYGPYEFERALQFGNLNVCARCRGSNSLTIMDAATGVSLSGSDKPDVTLKVPGSEKGDTHEMIFCLTAPCADLAKELDQIIAKAKHHLRHPVPVLAGSSSWSGQYAAFLDSPEVRQQLLAELDSLETQSQAIIADLTAIARYKNRLATHFLLERVEKHAPKFIADREEAKQTIEKTATRVEEIARRSARDAQTGQLIIPAQYAREYPPLVRLRDQCNRQIRRIDELIRVAGERLHRRVHSPELLGLPTPPTLAVLTGLPQELIDLSSSLSDERLAQRLAALEGPLGRELRTPSMIALTAPPLPTPVASETAPEQTPAHEAPTETLAVEDKVEFVVDHPAEQNEFSEYVTHNEEGEPHPEDDHVDLGF
jgi:ubiquitin-protein ligase